MKCTYSIIILEHSRELDFCEWHQQHTTVTYFFLLIKADILDVNGIIKKKLEILYL